MKSKETDWRHHIEAQKKSSTNIKEYCKRASLSYASFKYWRNKFQEKTKASLIPIQLTKQPAQEKNNVICKLVLNHGRCLEFYDKALVKELFQEVV